MTDDFDWESVTVAAAAQVQPGRRRPDPVQVRTGVVRTTTRLRIGMQIEDEPVIVIPPAAAAAMVEALREALRATAAR